MSSCNNVLSLWGVLMQQCVESVGCPHATICRSLWGVLMQQCVESVGCLHATMC